MGFRVQGLGVRVKGLGFRSKVGLWLWKNQVKAKHEDLRVKEIKLDDHTMGKW